MLSHGRRSIASRRAAAVLSLAVLASAVVVSPAAAIVNGTTDGTAHPAVGMMGTERSDGTFRLACSGTLLAPRVFLTAAHCVRATTSRDPDGPIYLWFGPEQQTGLVTTPGVVTGVGFIHPEYKPDFRNDIAVVILDQAVQLGAYPVLPSVGLLDDMKKAGTLASSTYTVVGYGVDAQTVIPGVGPVTYFTGERQSAIVGFNSLSKLWINQVQLEVQDYQGACNGDSGGPSFLGSGSGETNILVAVTSAGDIPCYATNVASRTDTPQAHDWVQWWLDHYTN